MTASIARVNGIDIAYRVQGHGPPLVLIMGYRLSSAAWPTTFVETLARRFTVVTMDNRGTGRSGKPVHGYGLANMARDTCALLDELAIARVHLLGYSMGGAIAQEFVRQFPQRVASLILCATMSGGARATYAKASVVQIMRDLDGLSPDAAARQIWKVTYAPEYLARNRQFVEEQMRREIARPTPLHAADLQFQAFAEFDGSRALANIRCPTLVLTGDLDELIPPQNSVMMAKSIPDAELVVLPGRGHRVLWESTQECVYRITDFVAAVDREPVATPPADDHQTTQRPPSNAVASSIEMFLTWPLLLASAMFDSMTVARQSIMAGSASRFGDGKPIILVAPRLGGDLTLLPLSAWLRAIGYRPVTTGLLVDIDGGARELALSGMIRQITHRIGRKAVLITHSIGVEQALRTAKLHNAWISDVIVLDATHRFHERGLRIHFIPSGWFVLQTIIELPRVLRGIGIELIGDTAHPESVRNGPPEQRKIST
jgi:pimeloyl-ACP methyl ester carboxylesterase